MTTAKAKTKQDDKTWYLLDLKDQILGRAATQISHILRGKDKPNYVPHLDSGTFIVAINADKIKLTGNKLDDKIYYKHTGHMGGLKDMTARELLDRNPTELITKAVKGMLPRGPLGRHQLKKFKVYAGADHPHGAQKPQELKL